MPQINPIIKPPTLPPMFDPILDKDVWGIFIRNKSGKKYTVHGKLNDPSTMTSLINAYKVTQKNPDAIVVLSLPLASNYLPYTLNFCDVDFYKGYDDGDYNKMKEVTYSELSPSGEGAHCFFTTEKGTFMHDSAPEQGYDWRYNSFATMTFNQVSPTNEIKHWTNKKLLKSKSKPVTKRLMNPLNSKGKLSPIWCYNQLNTMESILETYGYTQVGKKWKSPASTSGAAGIHINESLRGNWDGCYSHHDDILKGEWLDPYGALNKLSPTTIAELAKTTKAIDPNTGELLSITVDEYNKKESKRPRHYLPNELIFPDSPWGQLIHAICESTSYRYNPVGAMSNAISMIAYLSGGAYTTHSYDSTDIGIVNTGSSKVGKSQTMLGAKRYIPDKALPNVMSRMAGSEQGFQDMYADFGVKPDAFFTIDEIGFLFNDMKKGSGGGDVSQTILELLANGHAPYTKRATAKSPPIFIPYPHLVIAGNTTHEALKGGLTKEDIMTGNVNRWLFFDVTQDVGIKRKQNISINQPVLTRCREIFDLASKTSVDKRKEGVKIAVDDAVADYMYELDKAELNNNTSNMKARHNQTAFTLAMIRAIYEQTPVTLALFKWGHAVVKHCLMFTEYLFKVVLVEERFNPNVALEEKILECLTKHGGKYSVRNLQQDTSSFTKKCGGTNTYHTVMEGLTREESPILEYYKEGRKNMVRVIVEDGDRK